MAIKTKIRIKNGKWEINGKTLSEYKGDRKVIDGLLMSTFRINRIQSSVDDADFIPETQPKQWESMADVIATVNRSYLKEHNHKFKKIHYDNSQTPDALETYPNIATVSFVRAIGEE
jgi:hypothetical protein